MALCPPRQIKQKPQKNPDTEESSGITGMESTQRYSDMESRCESLEAKVDAFEKSIDEKIARLTQAATPNTTKIENQINQMEKRLDKALELAMKPTQMDMTDLLAKLAPMIHGLMMKFIPQQQAMMNQPMFNPHQQMNYQQQQMQYNQPSMTQQTTTNFTSPPRTKSPANIHALQRTPDSSPAGKKPRPAEVNDLTMDEATATQLDDQFAATSDTSPDGLPPDLQ
jgi:hypothetical protein